MRWRWNWDALATVKFGFYVGDIAFGEVIEELPGSVFLLHLRQDCIHEYRSALAFLSCGSNPFAQIGKITAKRRDIDAGSGTAVPRNELNWRLRRKLAEGR